jgi:beta-lactamase class A
LTHPTYTATARVVFLLELYSMDYQDLQKRNKVLERRWKILLIFAILFLATRPVALFIVNNLIQKAKDGPAFPYHLLNPSLRVIDKPVIDKANYSEFQQKLATELNLRKSEGKVKELSVFFRDLNNGPTFTINEDQGFIPASLLKLPWLITYLKLSEEDNTILSHEYKVDKINNVIETRFPPSKKLEEGKSYTVEELLERLIIYSDNQALEILTDHLKQISPNKDLFLETYKELGIIETDGVAEDPITPDSYSSMFRLLYNASYLSKENSNKALEILSKVEFNDGLERGLPDDLVVAHKFGERESNGVLQLHDCGIIYYPDNPYLLCVMTEGDNWDELMETIEFISRSVYAEVDSRKL